MWQNLNENDSRWIRWKTHRPVSIEAGLQGGQEDLSNLWIQLPRRPHHMSAKPSEYKYT